MLVIHPEVCIDCGVCVPECPVDAIKADTQPGMEEWVALNQKYAVLWPNITVKKPAPVDADKWRNVKEKLQYLSEKPGA